MEQLLQVGELLLLVLLTVLQLGRWSQKTEDGPADALRNAREAKAKADETAEDLRKHRHAWNNFLNTRWHDLDKVYARKEVVELQIQNVRDKQDGDCDRITEVEEKLRRFSGV